jgi:hypothetical protein
MKSKLQIAISNGMKIHWRNRKNKMTKPTIDQLLAENDSLRFKIGRLEQQLKYHKEFFGMVKHYKLNMASDMQELYDLLNDIQEHGE